MNSTPATKSDKSTFHGDLGAGLFDDQNKQLFASWDAMGQSFQDPSWATDLPNFDASQVTLNTTWGGQGSGGGSSDPWFVTAGDYKGSLERIARDQLPADASQREINNYVGQLVELNGIKDPRAIQADAELQLPDASTPAATKGLGVYAKDIAYGEMLKQQQAAADAQSTEAAQWNISAMRANFMKETGLPWDYEMASNAGVNLSMDPGRARGIAYTYADQVKAAPQIDPSTGQPYPVMRPVDEASENLAAIRTAVYAGLGGSDSDLAMVSRDPVLGAALGMTALPVASGILLSTLRTAAQDGYALLDSTAQTLRTGLSTSDFAPNAGVLNLRGPISSADAVAPNTGPLSVKTYGTSADFTFGSATPTSAPELPGTGTNPFATSMDKAYFWSGLGRGGSGVATDIAAARGGTTLESLIANRGIDMPVWDAANPASVQAWSDASASYAQGASGTVRAVLGDSLRPGNIWEGFELPALRDNFNVRQVIRIDPKTGLETVVFER